MGVCIGIMEDVGSREMDNEMKLKVVDIRVEEAVSRGYHEHEEW